MSAWAVFSMMGIYPDCPATPYYTISTPTFDKVSIRTAQGNVEIRTHRPDSTSHYIERITLDGKRCGYRVSHQDLVGSTIEITTKRNK
jgi:putative alpha-1,2-mannosidase